MPDAIGTEPEFFIRCNVTQSSAVFIIIYLIGVLLIGQKGLYKREGEQCNEEYQQYNGYLLFEEHAEGASPIRIVGITDALGFGSIVMRKLEQIVRYGG